MNLEEIKNRFALLCGLTAAEASQWSGLCQSAYDRIRCQCRDDVDLVEQGSVLSAAAAALAFYEYVLCREEQDGGDFAAGEVKITKGGRGIDCARALWQQAQVEIAPLLRSDTFFFGVTGRWHHEAQ